jgi:hypothetical protein
VLDSGHYGMEMVSPDIDRAKDIGTMVADSLITMQPCAIGSESNQIREWKLVAIKVSHDVVECGRTNYALPDGRATAPPVHAKLSRLFVIGNSKVDYVPGHGL